MRLSGMWLAPAGTEFLGKTADGEMVCASEDGVQPAMDLTRFLQAPFVIESGEPHDHDH